MSDALSYLVKARPEAMGHYFRFLKEAGSQLDPKTRALISVITKVHAQTAAGFRQYVRRALRDGASAAEILDAMLMAFPALGLTRIVWATDQLLEMDLPEFRLEALSGKAWHDLGPLDAFTDGATARVEADGRAVFVHRDGSTCRVWDGRCPHQSTELLEAGLEGTRLTCRKHGWTFDTATGACVAQGDRPLHEFESRIEDGRLAAEW